MAFTSLPAPLIGAGKAVVQSLWQYTKDNFDDHETRISNIEGVVQKIIVFNDVVINASQYISSSTLEGFFIWRTPMNFDLTTAELTITTAGLSGTSEFDLLFGNTLSAMTSVFSTKPSVPFSAGNNTTSSNAVFSTTSITANQWLRLDLTSFQDPQHSFHIRIFGEV